MDGEVSEKNRKIIQTTWGEYLAGSSGDSTIVGLYRQHGRLLWVGGSVSALEQPPESAVSENMIRPILNSGWKITFIPRDDFSYSEERMVSLQKLDIERLYKPHFTQQT